MYTKQYEWDEIKNQANLKKHGILFEEAGEIFKGIVFTAPDGRRDYQELRSISIGELEKGVVIVVVHTERNNWVRIISARKANEQEREKYMSISKKRRKKIKQIRDAQIDYSEIPELDPRFWKTASVSLPQPKTAISFRVDSDVLEWFKEQGQGYQTRMNAVLRSFYKAHGG